MTFAKSVEDERIKLTQMSQPIWMMFETFDNEKMGELEQVM